MRREHPTEGGEPSQEGSDSVSLDVEVEADSLIAITERLIDHAGNVNSLVQRFGA